MSVSILNRNATIADGSVSVEYFPPVGLSSERALLTAAHAMRRFSPAFQTVTFGAGASSERGAAGWARQLQELCEVPTACHVALSLFTRKGLFHFVDGLWAKGIRHLVVIRGDGEGGSLMCFNSVAEAVAALKERHDFEISVSAYPEVHPLARSPQKDFDVLKAKQDAGAKRAITQFFFNNDDFYRFVEAARGQGIALPIIPGIMPIANFDKIKSFAEACGAEIPSEFYRLFAAADSDKAAQSDVARTIAQKQVEGLAENGVNQIHIYSLNRVDLAAHTARAFQSKFSVDDARQALAG